MIRQSTCRASSTSGSATDAAPDVSSSLGEPRAPGARNITKVMFVLFGRQSVPRLNLHGSVFPQVRYCRGCFVCPAGGTQLDILTRSSNALVSGLLELSQVLPPTPSSTSGLLNVGRSTRCEFAQVGAVPPGRSVGMARPFGSQCDKTLDQHDESLPDGGARDAVALVQVSLGGELR
jgi:hypothetical protein